MTKSLQSLRSSPEQKLMRIKRLSRPPPARANGNEAQSIEKGKVPTLVTLLPARQPAEGVAGIKMKQSRRNLITIAMYFPVEHFLAAFYPRTQD